MNNFKKITLFIIFSFYSVILFGKTSSAFVTVDNGKFFRNGKPYYFVGTNFWYGAILASEGKGGNRQRLCRELDLMKHYGINNLRVLVSSDGKSGVPTKVEPTLQKAPGVYNDTILAGLDFLLMEMQKRDMVAVLYLNNSWEWSGGYSFYLEHAGYGKQPMPNEAGYPAYMEAMAKYASATKAHQLFFNHVKFILSRTNRYTHRPYIDDPTIMSWQIGNEPRAFSTSSLPAFQQWLSQSSALIREIAPHQLVSIGSEGAWGCENSYEWYEKICADKNVDYCNIHLWPYNWGWAKPNSLVEDLPVACRNTEEYINKHVEICQRLKKPLVMEEFGYPRDGFKFSKDISTIGRDKFYDFVFRLIVNNSKNGGVFAGCNFWGWGGYANPQHENWIPGDDYCGDPAQEAQGLNSVFSTDISTLKIIKQNARKMSKR